MAYWILLRLEDGTEIDLEICETEKEAKTRLEYWKEHIKNSVKMEKVN